MNKFIGDEIMFNSGNTGFSMPVVPAYGVSSGGSGSGNNGFGEGSWIWVLVIFALLFGWGNNGNNGGGNSGGGSTQFIPYSVGGYGCDGAVQRGFDQQAVITKLDGLTYGLSDSTYALNNSINNGFFGVQQTLCQGFNGVSREVADCCCKTQSNIQEVNYNIAKGFCDLGNVINNNTRDILESNNASTRAILDFLTTDKIQTLQSENQSLRLAASQADQNAVLRAAIDASTAEIIRRTGNDCPVPAYVVNGPTPINFPTNCCGNFTGFGYNNGCGCGCN